MPRRSHWRRTRNGPIWVNMGDGREPTLHDISISDYAAHLSCVTDAQRALTVAQQDAGRAAQEAAEVVAGMAGETTGGTFTLGGRGQQSAPLGHDASADEVQEALEQLDIAADDVIVSGGGLLGGPFTVTFMGTEEVDEMAETFPPRLIDHGPVDIDVDSSSERRAEIRQYLEDRYVTLPSHQREGMEFSYEVFMCTAAAWDVMTHNEQAAVHMLGLTAAQEMAVEDTTLTWENFRQFYVFVISRRDDELGIPCVYGKVKIALPAGW